MKIFQHDFKWGEGHSGSTESLRFSNSYFGDSYNDIPPRKPLYIGVNTSSNSITWNKMVDGTLVQSAMGGRDSAGVARVTPDPAVKSARYPNQDYAAGNFLNKSANGDGLGQYGHNGSGESVTIDGMAYNIHCVRFDANEHEYITGAYPQANMWFSPYSAIFFAVEDAATFTQFPAYDIGNMKNARGYRKSNLTDESPWSYLTQISTTSDLNLPLIAVPATKRCYIDYEGGSYAVGGTYDTGLVISSPDQTIPLSVVNPNGGDVTDFVAKVGGVTVFSQPSISTGQVNVSLAGGWNSIPNGPVSMTVECGSGASKSYTFTLKFNKVETGMVVQGVPVDKTERPTQCELVYALTQGQGATVNWYVCNNANDTSPAWEEYTGGPHTFQNESKTASSWAINWRIVVDGSSASTATELIKQVAMAVV